MCIRDRYQGMTDIELSQTGIKQAECAAKRFENIEIDNYIIYNKNNLFIDKQMLIEAIKNVKIY